MSLSRTIRRLARAIRKEAARNPAFADELDAILRAHIGAVADAEEIEGDDPETDEAAGAAEPAPRLNPVAVLSKQGEEALAALLADPAFTRAGLLALAQEHNLDPAGETPGMGREQLARHIVANAKRRVERDKKLFDY